MLDNLSMILMAMLTYLVFWLANTIASLVLNLVVIGEDWNRDKFIKSIWRMFGMFVTVVLLAIGLSVVDSPDVTIETLANIITVAGFTRLAEAITKVKDMFGYKAIDPDQVINVDIDTDEYHED